MHRYTSQTLKNMSDRKPARTCYAVAMLQKFRFDLAGLPHQDVENDACDMQTSQSMIEAYYIFSTLLSMLI